MPVLHNVKDATWNASDAADFANGVEKIRKLICFPSNHFTTNEVVILKAMAKKLNEIADLFEPDVEHTPLQGYEVRGLSGLRASMGVNGVESTPHINRSRLWDGTEYLSRFNPAHHEYMDRLEELNE